MSDDLKPDVIASETLLPWDIVVTRACLAAWFGVHTNRISQLAPEEPLDGRDPLPGIEPISHGKYKFLDATRAYMRRLQISARGRSDRVTSEHTVKAEGIKADTEWKQLRNRREAQELIPRESHEQWAIQWMQQVATGLDNLNGRITQRCHGIDDPIEFDTRVKEEVNAIRAEFVEFAEAGLLQSIPSNEPDDTRDPEAPSEPPAGSVDGSGESTAEERGDIGEMEI